MVKTYHEKWVDSYNEAHYSFLAHVLQIGDAMCERVQSYKYSCTEMFDS